MSVTHDRENVARNYFGESEAQPLLRWLNTAKRTEKTLQARARVEDLINSILQLQREARRGWKRKPTKEFIVHQKSVNVSLGNYQLTQRADCSRPPALEWTLVGDHDHLSRDYVQGEAPAVVRVVELAKQGRLERVRKCDCGEYFFARLPAQRFHAAACRVQFWESSLERKQRRREKAREYYNLHRSGKVK